MRFPPFRSFAITTTFGVLFLTGLSVSDSDLLGGVTIAAQVIDESVTVNPPIALQAAKPRRGLDEERELSTAETQLSAARVHAAIQRLGADSFETRRTAFLRLWQQGTSVLPRLDDRHPSGLNKQQRELLGALRILIKLNVESTHQVGVTQLVDLLSDLRPKSIARLCELKRWEMAQELLQRDEDLQDEFSDAYGKMQINRIVDHALQQGDPELAWPIVAVTTEPGLTAWIGTRLNLPLSSPDPRDAVALSDHLFFSGKPQAALDLPIPLAQRLRLVCRSYQWDLLTTPAISGQLTASARPQVQSAVKAVLLAAAGEYRRATETWQAALQLRADQALQPPGGGGEESENGRNDGDFGESHGETEKPGSSTADDGGNRSNNADLNSAERDASPTEQEDQIAFELLTDLSESNRNHQPQFYQFMMALLLDGRVAPVQRFYDKTNSCAAFALHMSSSDYVRALRALGLDTKLSDFNAWLEEHQTSIVRSLDEDNQPNSPGLVAARLANLLLSIGERDKAIQVLDMLADVADQHPRHETEIWTQYITRMTSRGEARMVGLQVYRQRYSGLSPDCRRRAADRLFPEFGGLTSYLLQTIPDSIQARSSDKWELLERLYLLDSDYFGRAAIDIPQWIHHAFQRKLQDEISSDDLIKIAGLAQEFDARYLATDILSVDLQQRLGPSAVNLHWVEAAGDSLDNGKLAAALEKLAAVRSQGLNIQPAYRVEIEALLLDGQYESAARLDRSRWLRPLATTRMYEGASYSQVVEYFSERGETSAALQYAEPAFLFSDPGSIFTYWAASDLSDLLEEQDDYAGSADVQRAALIESLRPYSIMLQYLIGNDFVTTLGYAIEKQNLARTVACIEQQRYDAARYHLNVAHRLQPQDIEMVVQGYPRLIQAGEKEFARQMFDMYERRMLEQLERWPFDATTLNNLAWMYVKCDRRLSRAAELARRAVEQAPHAPEYVDTLAEIQHAQGERSAAVETMRDCIRIAPRDERYRDKYQRYRRELNASERESD